MCTMFCVASCLDCIRLITCFLLHFFVFLFFCFFLLLLTFQLAAADRVASLAIPVNSVRSTPANPSNPAIAPPRELVQMTQSHSSGSSSSSGGGGGGDDRGARLAKEQLLGSDNRSIDSRHPLIVLDTFACGNIKLVSAISDVPL